MIPQEQFVAGFIKGIDAIKEAYGKNLAGDDAHHAHAIERIELLERALVSLAMLVLPKAADVDRTVKIGGGLIVPANAGGCCGGGCGA